MQVKSVWKSTNDKGLAMAEAGDAPITSVYHANAIVKKAARGETADLELYAISVGDVAFISVPCEMFCQSGMDIKAGSPFKMTFIMAIANDYRSYIPTETAFANGGYEPDVSWFLPGTAEELADVYVGMLKELKAESKN